VVAVYWNVFENVNTCHGRVLESRGKVLEKSLNFTLLEEGNHVQERWTIEVTKYFSWLIVLKKLVT